MKKRTLDIYYSDDNLNYTKLPQDKWKYRRDDQGNVTLLIPDGISARFVKVHSKFNERKAEVNNQDTGFEPVQAGEFTNILKDVVRVYRRETKATLRYDYDSVGNRLNKKSITNTIEETNYTYAENTNQLLTNGKYAYKYDKAGNMIRKGNKYKLEDGEVEFTKKKGKGVRYWKYEYNLQNRLSKVYKNGKLIAEFAYDTAGNRIKAVKHTPEGKKGYPFCIRAEWTSFSREEYY